MKVEEKQPCNAVPQTGALTGLRHAPTSVSSSLAASQAQQGAGFVHDFVHQRPRYPVQPYLIASLIALGASLLALGAAKLWVG